MAKVRAEFIIPHRHSRASVTSTFRGVGDRVTAYDIDSAMDTDTDNWTVSLGVDDPGGFVQDMLDRDSEVRVNLYALGHGGVETLHSGFADEITLDEQGMMVVQGRDITAVAVDSQHPPQVWHAIRPEVLVAREARLLKIGGSMKLTKARGFKTYATDGSESYWQVWYRFYRKRRMWMWAEADGTLNAMALHYNQTISYYFGEKSVIKGQKGKNFIAVESCSIRSNKQQRVGEVFYFGHRGDIGFVGSAADPSTKMWIKRPTMIVSSGDAHNQAEARVEAWEEIFESKVGAIEITLTVADPGWTLRQDKMAFINLPSIGLKGEYYVVGSRQIGSVEEGFYQVVRLREKNYAVSRRVPSDPVLKSGSAQTSGGSGIAGGLSIDAASDVRQFFVNAANAYHGPWDFKLFLGVLLAIADKESSFSNVREGGHTEYPGTANGAPPDRGAVGGESRAAFAKFQGSFSNEKALGHANQDFGVGFMQLTSLPYKLAADRLSGGPFHDELYGGRWDAESNIMAGAAALADKLGAGFSISADGHIVSSKITGLSLQPSEANIWQGVMEYNGGGNAARAYMLDVRSRYTATYKTVVADAISAAKSADVGSTFTPGASSAELRSRVLNNSMITFTRQSQRDDIRRGLIKDHVMNFLLWLTDAGYPATITALKSDHSLYTSEGRLSAHGDGRAVDVGNYSYLNPHTTEVMKLIGKYQKIIGFDQLIGPNESLVIPAGRYDRQTLNEHKSHIHVGFGQGVT
jgi:prophage tail gpP-like protein